MKQTLQDPVLWNLTVKFGVPLWFLDIAIRVQMSNHED